MFCRWCGADIPDNTMKCTSCGKELPAKSDCGGFFNLAPNARRPVAEPVILNTEPTPAELAKDPPSKQEPKKGKKRSGRQHCGFQLVVTLLGFVIVIALLLVINGKLEDIDSRMDGISAELQQTAEPTAPSQESTTPPTSEAPAEGAVGSQEVRLEIKRAMSETEENKWEFSAVLCGEDGSLAELPDDAEFTWEYCLEGKTEWVTLDEEFFEVSEDGATVKCSVENLETLLDGADHVQFRVTYTTFTTVTKQMLTVSE